MKKEVTIKYNRKRMIPFIRLVFDFTNSDREVIKIRYSGDQANFDSGFKKDIIKSRVPIKFVFIFIKKMYIQMPIFRLIRGNQGSAFKNKIYRFFGAKIGKDVVIGPDVFFDMFLPELISIGNGSLIGKDSTLLTHEFTVKGARFGKIKIGKQVLIGANSIIRSGVSIGDGAVIAMDSLVTKDIPPMEEWGGIPAKKIKKLKKII